MSHLKSSMNILLVVAVSIFIVSCSKEEPPPPVDEVVGCFQVLDDACASPTNEQQCEDMNGRSFHEGGTCRTDSGTCGVLHEEG